MPEVGIVGTGLADERQPLRRLAEDGGLEHGGHALRLTARHGTGGSPSLLFAFSEKTSRQLQRRHIFAPPVRVRAEIVHGISRLSTTRRVA